MDYDILMTKLGTAEKYKVMKLNVSLGQPVKVKDPLFEVEAGKANKQVVSEFDGIIKEIYVDELTELEVGEKILTIEGEAGQGLKVAKQETKKKDTKSLGGYFNIQMQKPKKALECDIAIIGGGPGGYVAAIKASQGGKKVILIEKEKMGGTCLNRGCIPTKALVRSVEVLENINNSQKYGLGQYEGDFDFSNIIERKNQVVGQLVAGIEHLMGSNHVEVIYGLGKFQDRNTLTVEGKDFDATIRAENIIIATGSRPAKLPIPGIDNPNVLNSTELLNLRKLPKSMIIVGGGVIGMEFAFILNALGVEVSVIEMMPQILPLVDGEVVKELHNIATNRGIKIHTAAKLERIEEIENGGNLVVVQKDDKKLNLVGEQIFISIGRAFNTEELELSTVGIEMDQRAIRVDERLRTNIENIYGIGDINGKYMLAHVASMEGVVAIENILGVDKTMDYTAVPSAIFTSPEIAFVGLKEEQARDRGIEVKIGRFPYAANGKALAAAESEGFVKIIGDEGGKILGGWVIGYNAADLIPQITLAMKNGLTVEEIANTIYAHPTISECIPEACHGVFDRPIHLP